METLYIEAERTTPEVLLRPEADLFYISGNSFPANPFRFYEPIHNWFETLVSSGTVIKSINLRFEFNYLNTSSQKQIILLIKQLEKGLGKEKVSIIWCYNKEDKDMLEAGQRLQNLTKLKFEFNTIQNSEID